MVRVGVVALSVALLGLTAAQAASARTLVVDNDRAQCPTAPYRTIQSAVDAAAAGDTVRVCPGGYREQVYIRPNKPRLTLEASAHRLATILAPKQFVDNPRLRAIVVAAGKGDVVRGFRIAGRLPNYPFCGDFTHDVGVQIGADLVRVEDNQIYGIADNCGHGSGIWAGDAEDEMTADFSASGAVVSDNLIEQYLDTGVIVEQTPSTARVKILDNQIFGAQSRPTIGVLAGQEGTVDVRDNLISSNRSFGIALSGGINTGDHIVRDNRIRGNGVGLDVGGEGGSLVADNDVSANRSDGIVDDSDFGRSQILDNTSRDNGGSGFLLLSSHSRVSGNQSLRNRGDGLRVEGAGYTLDHNTASRNIGRDCRDTTAPGGPGTLGTLNTWTLNHGRTSSPAGLCAP